MNNRFPRHAKTIPRRDKDTQKTSDKSGAAIAPRPAPALYRTTSPREAGAQKKKKEEAPASAPAPKTSGAISSTAEKGLQTSSPPPAAALPGPVINLPVVLVVVGGIILFLLFYKIRHYNRMRQDLARRELEVAIARFPPNPMDYNTRQRAAYWMLTRSQSRPYNFMAAGITGTSVLALVGAMIARRARRVVIQKRKSLPFWIATGVAAFSAACYGAFVTRRELTARQALVRGFSNDPRFRGSVYLTSILTVAALMAYCCGSGRPRGRGRRMRMRRRRDERRRQ